MRNARDYFHLHIGGEIELTDTYSDGMLTIEKGKRLTLTPDALVQINDGNMQAQLVLRPLSDMKLEEVRELFDIGIAPEFADSIVKEISSSLYELHKRISQMGNFDSIRTLLKMEFDIHNLIPEGIALTKTLK